MSDINDELRGAAEDARREIRGLENIMGNDRGMLHHIHEPGRDGEDDPGASPFWHAVAGDGYMKVTYHVDDPGERAEHLHARLRASAEAIRKDPTWNGPPLIIPPAGKPRRPAAELEQLVADLRDDQSRFTRVEIITTPAIKARYAATLERLARERNEAAYEWNSLRWWQWRKRKRLWRKLYGIGGWRLDPQPDSWRTAPMAYIPERVTRCGRFIKHYREGGC